MVQKKSKRVILGLWFPLKDLRQGSPFLNGGLTYKLPFNLQFNRTPKIFSPQLQGILCKVCSPFLQHEFKLAHTCMYNVQRIYNELIWMREERKWLRHPLVRLTAATVQQDKGLGRCNQWHLPLLNLNIIPKEPWDKQQSQLQSLQVSVCHVGEAPISSLNVPPECARVCLMPPEEVCYSIHDSKENLPCYTINVFTVVTLSLQQDLWFPR